ncbi:MAG: sigma-54-dependent Fis family transcriptional regulator, partial [Gammaproteobacteria bacterium]|nr:sigma-54-dependent Fis family transcriptional regulator [Gammaproteobacteria bacterium]
DGCIIPSKGVERISIDPTAKNIFSYCATSGKTIWIEDIYRSSGYDLSWNTTLDVYLGVKTRSVLVLPIVNNDGELYGVMQLSGITKEQYDDVEYSQTIKSFISYSSVILETQRYRTENMRLLRLMEVTNRRLNEENSRLKKTIHHNQSDDQFVSDHVSMKAVTDLVVRVANSDATVLIQGDTGTGKEHVAKSIHMNSTRHSAPYIIQNCAALPENLLESELFGYKRGAFTGADRDKEGLITLADNGTMFLDEIAELSLSLQAKLLRVLQEKEIRPLGGTKSRKVDVRFVAATHKNLSRMVKEGLFREDLYYRLNIVPIKIPALRERREDISRMATYFLSKYAKQYSKNVSAISPEYIECLENYSFPGNIRELKNLIERGVILIDDGGALTLEHLPDNMRDLMNQFSIARFPSNNSKRGLKQVIENYEAKVIKEKLAQCHWNQSKTAIELKIGRRTLIDKIQRYQISRYN